MSAGRSGVIVTRWAAHRLRRRSAVLQRRNAAGPKTAPEGGFRPGIALAFPSRRRPLFPAVFLVDTAMVVAEHGYLGFFALATANSATSLMLFDLTICLTLAAGASRGGPRGGAGGWRWVRVRSSGGTSNT